MSNTRKLSVDGKEFTVVIGRSNVKIRCGNVSKVVSFPELTGMSWHDIERGIWKKWFKITPKDICDYIRTQSWAPKKR